jgi:hypothetical protein
MEAFDQETIRQVWNRVNSNCAQGPDFDQLRALMCQELTDAATLLQLSKKVGGHGGTLLKLAGQCRQHAGYLRGICTMIGQDQPVPANPPPATVRTIGALQKCYVNSLLKGNAISLSTEEKEDGTIVVHADCDGLIQKFIFTPV